MDMNWIDEIRDPEPRKRYIYNADDYDPQYGDPYYREHSTRADSLWRLYEESGTSITFDAFADESRQTDYRMETGALRDFFNGSQSALSSYRNPMGGNPLIAFGSIGRWDGERTGISSFETFDDLMNGDDSPFKDCEIDHIWDENGILKMRGHHHDGSVEVEIPETTVMGWRTVRRRRPPLRRRQGIRGPLLERPENRSGPGRGAPVRGTRVRMPAHRMGHRCQGEGLRRTHGRRIYEPVRAGHDRHQGR